MALGFVLRVATIGAEELWLDEAFSFHIVRLADWSAALRLDNTPPLYYLLLRLWIPLAGKSEGALRLLSALFGTAAVAVAVWAASRIFDRAAALWTGLVTAAAPIQVYYGQEARAYALLVLLLFLHCGLVRRAAASNRTADWAAVALSATLALYTHYLAALALTAAAFLPVFRRDSGQARRSFAALGASVVLFLPWVALTFEATAQARAGVAWIRNIWEQTPPAAALPRSLELFALGSQAGLVPLWLKRFGAIEFPFALRCAGLAALVALGLSLGLRKGEETPADTRWVAALLFAPLAALWAISWVRPLYAAGRYDSIAYPGFALLMGLGFARLERATGSRAARVAILLGFWVAVAAKLVFYYRVAPERQAEPAAAFLDS
ncbi:MAG: hypothetical protein DMG07_22830, partial [Acidobacteria bacterium]